MGKGKREITHTTSKHSKHNSSRGLLSGKKGIFILIIGIVILMIYIFPNFKNTTTPSNSIENVKSSNIENTKTIIGLEDVEILGIDIESRTSSSLFSIKVHNKSNNIIPESKVHFYAIDSEGKTIFGMPIVIPELQLGQTNDVKVFCTDDISNAIDYNIVTIVEEE